MIIRSISSGSVHPVSSPPGTSKARSKQDLWTKMAAGSVKGTNKKHHHQVRDTWCATTSIKLVAAMYIIYIYHIWPTAIRTHETWIFRCASMPGPCLHVIFFMSRRSLGLSLLPTATVASFSQRRSRYLELRPSNLAGTSSPAMVVRWSILIRSGWHGMTWLENPQTKDRAELGKSWKILRYTE